MDEHSQAGRRGLEAAQAKGVPVIIMEPLRGGRLVGMLPKAAQARIAANSRGYTAAQWALNWLWNQPGVTCVLSGMNSLEMVRENLKSAAQAQAGMLTGDDLKLIGEIRNDLNGAIRVGCTGCGYCMPCPQGVDIPAAFRCLNDIEISGKFAALKSYWQITAIRQTPGSASRCIGCGKCERHCPQGLPICEKLKEASRELEPPIYRAARWLVQRWKPW